MIELSIVILIIGIIVAGVTQSSRLIGAFKLSTARNLTQSSPVASIKDLALWLESTSEKSFDLSDQDDGNQVDNWYDINPQSTTKINLTQATSNKQPLYKTATGTINSLPTLKFDGVTGSVNGDYLSNITTPLTTIAQADQITIFIVEKVNSSVNNSTFFITTDDGTNRINFHSPETGAIRFDFGTITLGSPAARMNVSTPSGYISNTKVTTLIRRPSSSSAIRVNGADATTASMSSTFSDASLGTTLTAFNIGAISAAAYQQNAYLGEFIIFRRALKADEITDVERYLGKKWGITIP